MTSGNFNINIHIQPTSFDTTASGSTYKQNFIF
jgi:hypothetical protein